LTRLVNAVITPGGEISKRRAFVQVADLTGSFGLASTETTLYVFGRNVVPPTPATGVPGVTIGALKVPNSNPALEQWDYDVFDGKIYLSAHDPGIAWRHYYDDGTAGGVMVETEGTGKGQHIRTYQSKIYGVMGKYLYFSAIDDPVHWNTGTGHGYINLSLQDADSETLTSLEVYYDKLAVFSSEATQIWAIDPDPLANAYLQLLRGNGTNAPRSPLQYGSGDVQYLDQSGIRSLKARDSSNSAAVSDIGSPVDPTIQALRLLKGDAYMNKAVSLLEPSVGRFWMIFPDRVMVLSYFPGPKVTAWNELTLPELGTATVAHAVTCGGKIFIRASDDKLYVYGGIDGLAYNNCGVEVRLPYLDGRKPGHKKMFQAIDATVSGTWRVAVSFDFDNPDAEENLATLTKPTWNVGASELQGYDSHFSLRFYNEVDGPATISNCAVHYEMSASEE